MASSNNGINYPHPPTPSPDNPTVIVVVVICFGGLFVLGAILLGIWCIFKRHCKKKKKKLVHERKDVDVDEHLKVQELVLPGPHGPKTMVISVEDEVRVHEDVHKDEVGVVGKGLRGEIVEGGATSSHPEHQV
ncbi:hypothetical protein RND81_03G071100 [Saponaria officinalis]|uniref:Uncharacterized protein n=1 Tax=Saponaria officinalis TaxID=3572 RepID=A0AAW1LYN4_SAPOF